MGRYWRGWTEHTVIMAILLTGLLWLGIGWLTLHVRAAELLLSDWWFQTDACPNDPETICRTFPAVVAPLVLTLTLEWLAGSWLVNWYLGRDK